MASLPTVLIVDDDRANRTILADLLKDECRIVLAKDGTSALQRAEQEEDIALILLDVSMPDMDGYEALRRLRAHNRTRDTPIIFITASTRDEDEERGLEMGAIDYIFKPVRPAIFRARIRNHLKLVAQHRELERLAERDALTGIPNRRCFDQALDLACRHAARTGEILGLAMLDVDFFKQYNDTYGHEAGDHVLQQIAGVLAAVPQRPYDLAARYGGEEFVLLLPAIQGMDAVLEKLRCDILALNIEHNGSSLGVISLSSGGVEVGVSPEDEPSSILRRADTLLYEAKRLGRNRVRTERITRYI